MSADWGTDDIERLIDALGEAADTAEARTRVVVDKTANDVVADAQVAAPVRTGHLRSTIGHDLDPDGLGFEAGPTASYGADVEFGTVPHDIEPSEARALFWPGASHPVRRVHHPGTSPQPYLLPPFDRRVEIAMRAFEQIVSNPWPGA